MTRFRIVDPADTENLGFGDLADITIQATDGADPELPVGTELAVPEAFDAETLFGVPVGDITGITLDGRTWIPGAVAVVELIVGSGKRVDFEVQGPDVPKSLAAVDSGDLVRVHVSRIFAVTTSLMPTRQ